MNRCVVHFGMHKAGSTSIQHYLFHKLADERFHYIDLGSPNASGKIATGFMKDPLQYHGHRKLGTRQEELGLARQETLERLTEQVQLARGKTAILSGEVISCLQRDEFEKLCDTIALAGVTEIRAVGYVRSPGSYVESAFQQSVKGGRRSFRIEKIFPKYAERFRKFDEVLGEQNVSFWQFAPSTFPDGCVVQDFCARLGIDMKGGKAERANESLSLPAIQLLYAYRKFGPGFGVGQNALTENRFLIEHLGQLAGPKLTFHPVLIAPLVAMNRDDIQWMEERLGGSLLDSTKQRGACAVQSEVELLAIPSDAVQWLARQLGGQYLAHCTNDVSLFEVATWVHVLRQKLAARVEPVRKRRQSVIDGGVTTATERASSVAGAKSREISAAGLLGVISYSRTGLLGGLDAVRSVGLIVEAFRLLRQSLAQTHAGGLRAAGLGTFQIHANSGNRRIIFRPWRQRKGRLSSH